MRPFRSLAVGAVALTAALAAALPAVASSADAATVNYAALGDSYSSGVGTGSESGSCGQSSAAYGPLWASAHGAAIDFAACSGATTSDVISSQLSGLSSSTNLVSLTIGGNDVGFTSIMETCVLGSDSSCQSAINSAEATATNTLPGRYSTMFADIKAKAPNAKVVLLDYPDFYDLNVSICIGLDKTKHTALDAGIDTLDGVMKTAATNAGVSFADVRGQFSGHELCDGSGWLHAVDFTDIGESYHPTSTGHSSGYLPVFTSAADALGF